jgi:hypothetical protein
VSIGVNWLHYAPKDPWANFDIQMFIELLPWDSDHRPLFHNHPDTNSVAATLYGQMGPMRREGLEGSNNLLLWECLHLSQ